MFKKYPNLKEKLWRSEFWSKGYFMSRVGKHGDEQKLRNYVKNQGSGKPSYKAALLRGASFKYNVNTTKIKNLKSKEIIAKLKEEIIQEEKTKIENDFDQGYISDLEPKPDSENLKQQKQVLDYIKLLLNPVYSILFLLMS